MDEQKHSLIDRLHQAQNILVTVSRDPSVDQLSAAIGLTLALNKLDKHGTAVFSGQVPSTLEFLKPDETLEKDTNSLRDFIIALDKSKADKLRYKVEDEVVRIFITPYRTSLSEKDLEFSQGDFNVDVVVALGVTEQQDLDTAITSHGRILHDATVVSVSTQGQGSLGSINWVDPSASSLSEMIVGLVDGLDKKVMDNQIATALLTGIVATTDRFRNEKTSPKTMSASAELMAAGANQQLIASELETPAEPAPEPEQPQENQNEESAPTEEHQAEPGTLEIDHEAEEEPAKPEAKQEPEPEEKHPQVHVDENGQLVTDGEEQLPEISQVRGVGNDGHPTENHREVRHERIMEPPRGDSDITANINPESYDPSTEELTLPAVNGPILTHNENVLPPADEPEPETPEAPEPEVPEADTPNPAAPFTPPMPPADDVPPPSVSPMPPGDDDQDSFDSNTTLSEIEEAVDSPHVHSDAAPAATASVDDARSAVEAALSGADNPVQPIAALNAQPLGGDLHAPAEPAAVPAPQVSNLGFSEPTPGNTPADETLDMPLPNNPFGPGQVTQPAAPNPLVPPAPAPFTPPAPQPQTPPSAFPGAPAPQQNGAQNLPPPPPVPPPMLPPLQ